MKNALLITTATILASHTAYADPKDNEFSTIRISPTRAFQSSNYSKLAEGLEYRIRQQTSKPTESSVLEEKLYVDVNALFTSQVHTSKGSDGSEKFPEEDASLLSTLYREGQLKLSWTQGSLMFIQYCVHPLDGFHTLSVTSESDESNTYYMQQRWEGKIGNSPIVSCYTDSSSQVEYWYDSKKERWAVEGRKGLSTFKERASAAKAAKLLGLKYNAKDLAEGYNPESTPYFFAHPDIRISIDEVERAKYEAYRPSLWTTLPLLSLTLSSTGLLQMLDYGLSQPTHVSPEPSRPEPSSYQSSWGNLVYEVPSRILPFATSLLVYQKAGVSPTTATVAAFGMSMGTVEARPRVLKWAEKAVDWIEDHLNGPSELPQPTHQPTMHNPHFPPPGAQPDMHNPHNNPDPTKPALHRNLYEQEL